MAPGTSWRHFVLRFAIALVVVALLAAGGIAYGNHEFESSADDIERVDIDAELLVPDEKGEPANFLIVGSDTRAFVESEGEAQAFGTEEDVGGERSDTIMVVHVDPYSGTGFVVSFPRDLWVEIPGHGSGRLNKTYGLGGPPLVIETIAANYDVHVNHYLQVDFQGFEQIVNTIGGVDLWFSAPARDGYSLLDVREPGCRELDGAQALAYVRSRHYEYYDAEDGRWRTDPRSDLSRIERQQYFMRSLAESALSRGARNPRIAFDLLDDVVDHLKSDAQLDTGDLKALINAFRDLDPASIEMMTVPTVSVDRGGADVLEPRQPDAEPIFNRLRHFGTPPELPDVAEPQDVRVRVLNGSGVGGRAREVLDALVVHGFEAADEPHDADRDDYPLTEVRWAAGQGSKGLAVASALGTVNAAEGRVDEVGDADVVVVVGRDWEELDAPVKQSPPATDVAPDDRDDREGSEQSEAPAPTLAPATSTTTTRPSPTNTAVVPADPETGGPLVGCP